jgi:thioredoxin-like negative regulator of GroEL
VDTEENPDLPAKYEVTNLPTVFFFKNWVIVDSFVGFIPENEILEKIEANK